MTCRKTVAALIISLVLLSSSGCLGRMAVTSNVRKFNMNAVENRWGREILFVTLYIIPVYPACAFADLCIVNAFEFWNGTNPITEEPALVDE